MEQSLKVAMPLTVLAVLLFGHVSVPLTGFAPIESEIVAVQPVVTTLPPASSIAAAGAGAMVPPAGALVGWATNAILTGGPTVTLNAALVVWVSGGVEIAVSL